MSEDDPIRQALREAGPRYIVDSHQRPLGFLLTPEEYGAYLEMCLNAETPSLSRDGVAGKQLLHFAGTIPMDDLQLMLQAIDADCETVDANEW